MKTNFWEMLCVAFVGSLMLTGSGFAEEKNMLANSGFEKCTAEEVKAQKIYGWEINTWPAPCIVELLEDKGKAHSGSKCLKLIPKSPGTVEAHVFQMCPGEVEPGKKYLLKAWVRSEGGAEIKEGGRTKLVIYQYDKDTKFVGSAASEYLSTSGTWNEFSFTYVPGKDAAKAGCAIVSFDGPLCFDDVSFSVKEDEKK